MDLGLAGPVDVSIGGFEAIDDAEWFATFDIGTLSAVRGVRHALALLRLRLRPRHHDRRSSQIRADFSRYVALAERYVALAETARLDIASMSPAASCSTTSTTRCAPWQPARSYARSSSDPPR